MKLLCIFASVISLFFRSSSPTIKLTQGGEYDLSLKAGAHLLMEYDSGKVLYENRADEKLYPASMTKMMGMLLVLEEMGKGKLNWDTMVRGSTESSSMGGTQIFLAPNETMRLEDLFKSVAINSANDAIVALGEAVSGSHQGFVKRMNERAGELNMKNTHFANATGFDNPDHYTSARDMALVARELLGFQEDVLRFTKMKESYIRTESDNPFWLVNTNKLLGHYDGLDGLKTGFTNVAMYNLTATAYRDGVRLISVTMKASSIKDRSADTVALMNYGFSKLVRLKIYPEDTILATYSFKNALNKDTPLYPSRPIEPIYELGVKLTDLVARIDLSVESAPIMANTVVGQLVIVGPKEEVRRYDVIVKEDVLNMVFMDYFLKCIIDYLF